MPEDLPPTTTELLKEATSQTTFWRRWLGEARWWKKLGWRAALYSVGLVGLWVSTLFHSYIATLVVALAFGVAAIVFHRLTSKPGDSRLSAVPGTKILVFALLIEIGIVICVTQDWLVFDIVGFAGLTLIVFGVGQLTAEVRGASHTAVVGTVALLWINVAFLVGGSVLAGLGGMLMLLIGLLLVLPAIALTSQLLIGRWAVRSGPALAVRAAIGLGACVLAVIVLRDIAGPRLGVVIVVLVALFVLLLASNTDADALVILFVVALVWSQYPRGDKDAPVFVDGAGQHELLVLGDSYISGEGARSYFTGTNTREPASYDQCRRSVNAWAVQVQRHLVDTATPVQLDFYACSGATVENVSRAGGGQHIGENPEHVYVGGNGESNHLLSQMELFGRHARQADVDWVFLSIGGNDAGFGDLVQECLGPGDCSRGGQPWLDKLETEVAPQVAKLYAELETRFHDRVVVVPYPIGISDAPCSVFRSTLTQRERRFLSGFTEQLDGVLRQQAAVQHVRYLDGMVDVFTRNHVRICDVDRANAAVNYIALNPVGGATDPTVWAHNSMHPNDHGHRLMAGVVEQWMQQPTPVEDPARVPAPRLSLTKIMDDGTSYCDRTPGPPGCAPATTPSLFDDLRAAARRYGLGIVALVLGALAASAALLARRRGIRDYDDDDPFAPWPSTRIDRMQPAGRVLVAVGVLATLFVLLALIVPAVAGVSGGYGPAQSKSTGALKALGEPAWRSYLITTTHDLVWYIPTYLVLGVIVVVLVARRASTPGRYETFTRLPKAAWLALGLLLTAAAADVAETFMFRWSLEWLIEDGADAHLGAVPALTRLMTFVKYGAGIGAIVTVVWMIVARHQQPPGRGDATGAAGGGQQHPAASPDEPPAEPEPVGAGATTVVLGP